MSYVEHVCQRCKDPFYTKSELVSHLKKKKKCEEQGSSPKVLEPKQCYCKKIFSTPGKLNAHKKKCVTAIEKNKELKNIAQSNEKKVNNTNNGDGNVHNNSGKIVTTKNVTVNNTTVNNFMIANYDFRRPIICCLTECEELELQNISKNPHLMLFERTYCNVSDRRFHNVRYDSDDETYVWVHSYGSWYKKKYVTVVNEIIYEQQEELNDYLVRWMSNLECDVSNHINKCTKYVDEDKNVVDKKGMREIYKNVRQLLIKHFDVIEPTFATTHNRDRFLSKDLPSRDSSDCYSSSQAPSNDDSSDSYSSQSDSSVGKKIVKKKCNRSSSESSVDEKSFKKKTRSVSYSDDKKLPKKKTLPDSESNDKKKLSKKKLSKKTYVPSDDKKTSVSSVSDSDNKKKSPKKKTLSISNSDDKKKSSKKKTLSISNSDDKKKSSKKKTYVSSVSDSDDKKTYVSSVSNSDDKKKSSKKTYILPVNDSDDTKKLSQKKKYKKKKSK